MAFRGTTMLDSLLLRKTIQQAIDVFVDRVTNFVPEPTKAENAQPLSPLGKRILDTLAKHKGGLTANDLAIALDIGLAPLFDHLRELMTSRRLLRKVRGNDQLPLYVLPKSQTTDHQNSL